MSDYDSSLHPPHFKISHLAPDSFLAQFWQTILLVFADKGVFTMLLIAPILYGFFYPWPYGKEVARQVPVAIVDNDHSPLSAKLIDYSEANPRLSSRVVPNELIAKQMMWKQQIAGYMVIPQGMYSNVLNGQPAKVSVLGNGGYFLLNKQVQSGFLEVIGTVSAGVEIKGAIARGANPSIAAVSTSPVSLTINPLYNTTEGYGTYIVPPVSMLILQQMYLMGVAMLIGTWAERQLHHARLKTWLARIAALSMFGVILGCFYYGVVFRINDYPRNQNLIGSIVMLLFYFPAVVTLGCILGIWLRGRERAMQVLVVSSMPMLFISGIPWPLSVMPEPLTYLRWILPSTSGMTASVMLNQMGATLDEVKQYLAALLILFLVGLILLTWLGAPYPVNEKLVASKKTP